MKTTSTSLSTNQLPPADASGQLPATDNTQLMATRFFPPYIHRVGQVINTVHQVHSKAGCRLTMGALSVAVRRPVRAADRAFYESGQRQEHRCGKHRFYTYTFGQGPAVLLLHGWCSNGARWAPYVQELCRAGYQAVVMDAPSHGQSPGRFLSVPDYIRCAGQLIRSRAHWHAVLAHSMGSLAGVISASEQAGKVRIGKFVLMSTFSNCDALMSKFARCLGVSETVLSDTRAWIPKYTGKPLNYFCLIEHLQQLGPPNTLLVADEKDIVVPLQETKAILNALPHVKPIITSGLGHNLRCDTVRRQVLNFITP
jgi:pimeloyl-ACP methyl ester carboxylesterase